MCRFTRTERNFNIKGWMFLSFLSLFALNISAQCDISCKSDINISIDENCQAVITADMVLSAPIADVTIEVYDEDDVLIPDNIVTLDHVGQEVKIIAIEPTCSNSCWGMALVEDKIPPIISCDDVTIGCADLIVFNDPIPVSCDVATIMVVGETNMDISCDSDDYQQQITRSYIAMDSNGNESEVCSQTITIEKFDLGLIDFSTNTDTTLYCGGDYEKDESGNPKFDILGGPTLSGEDLYPDHFIDCNTYVSYEDEVLSFNNCVTNVLRTWTLQNWFCGQDNFREFFQLYTIVDTVGPEFTTMTPDVTISTSGNSCSATYTVPTIETTDVCNDVDRVDLNFPGGFIEDGNGSTIILEAGNNVIEYIAYDECGNSSIRTFNAFVRDNAQPVTICDQFTTISLSSDGTALLSAEDLDDGSFDECGPVTLEIRRMGDVLCVEDDDEFGEYVTFCCDDLGVDHMVALRVTDASGNENICMATVEVQDKLAPVVLADLPDITVSCTFPYDPDNLEVFGKVATHPDEREEIVLSSDTVIFGGPALDALILDNCTSVSDDEITFESFNQCGLGYIIRTITASNPEGQSATISQRIDFMNNEAFTEDDIIWPLDYNPTTSCKPENLQPDDLPSPYDRPVFNDDECDMVGVTYKDEIVLNTPQGGGCFKIIRTWYVSDWCQDINNTFPVWTHEQYIEVSNDIAPTIDSDCAKELVCVYDAECGPGYIELEVTGSDDCVDAEDLIWSYEIDLQSDGNIEIAGSGNTISGDYEVGTHTITWTLSDGCGNFDFCIQEFEIRNCKTPTPYCLNGLTADLTAMDLDDDGLIDTEMLMLTPDFLDAGSSHICGYDVELSFSSEVDDTVRFFDCGDIGIQELEIWVTDVVNGNQDYCSTYIIIQDNNEYDFCDNGNTDFRVAGNIVTGNNEGVPNVNIRLEGTDYSTITNENGSYSFDNIELGTSFSVVPSYDLDPTNGVSTLDLILIQKHILGIQELDDPLKIIAGDINKSGDITAADLIQLRKLILGKYDGFPNNQSWRFLDSEHQFIQADNPWATDVPESYTIDQLISNMNIDFVGLKVGDVNSSVQMNANNNAVVRSGDAFHVNIINESLKKGEVKEITLNAAESYRILGYQWAVEIDNKLAEIIAVNGININQDIDNVGSKYIDKGVILNNRYDGNGIDVLEGENLISITIRAFENSEIRDLISVNTEFLEAESYNKDNDVMNMELDFREGEFSEVKLYQNSPNPWSNNTTIGFFLNDAKTANLIIRDIAGKIVYSKAHLASKGLNTIEINKTDILANGVYYYELITEDFKAIKKMIVSQ